jgi:hypothetical protein
VRRRGVADPDLERLPTRFWKTCAWQSRPLDAVYPILYLDAIHLNLRSKRCRSWKDAAPGTAEAAEHALEAFAQRMGTSHRSPIPTRAQGAVLGDPEGVRAGQARGPIRDLVAALNHFTMVFEGRVPRRL